MKTIVTINPDAANTASVKDTQIERAQYVSDEFMDGKKVKSVAFPRPLEVVITFIDNSRATGTGIVAVKIKRGY